jgi:hypothetical protein
MVKSRLWIDHYLLCWELFWWKIWSCGKNICRMWNLLTIGWNTPPPR